MKYGLLGEHLGHSFSKEIHEAISDYTYELKEVTRDNFDDFMKQRDFSAINVTIPYKEKVIPYLDYIDDAALSIGAVNTIVNKNGQLFGYNTDYLGLRDLITINGINPLGKKVIILGDGGTSKTTKAVMQDLGAKSIYFVSLNPHDDVCSYEDVKLLHADAQIIVNATPCGMYPNNDDLILDITPFKDLEAVIDVIYNPLQTSIVMEAKKRGITSTGGLYMLVAQAVYASSIFKGEDIKLDVIKETYQKLLKNKENIVLIGMPSSGKSTIGKILSEKLNKTLVDTDLEIEKVLGMPIASFLTKDNEKLFREIEASVTERIAKQNNLIISTGGGIIKSELNMKRLKANGIVFFIDRDINLLEATSSRPLSSSKEDLKQRFNERYHLYRQYADTIISNNNSMEEAVNQILEVNNENTYN